MNKKNLFDFIIYKLNINQKNCYTYSLCCAPMQVCKSHMRASSVKHSPVTPKYFYNNKNNKYNLKNII